MWMALCVCFEFSVTFIRMVVNFQGVDSGSGFGSGSGAKSSNDELCELIIIEVLSVILEDIHGMFGMIK